MLSDSENQGKDISKIQPITYNTVRDQAESSYAEEPRRRYCCSSLMASEQFVREEKKEREQVCVEQTWCVPAAHI